jgi:hypothetical protein
MDDGRAPSLAIAATGSAGATNGYQDKASCYTVIQAPEDDQVRFTFTQMNLELTGCHANAGPGQGCPAGGCDYVELFDGPDQQVGAALGSTGGGGGGGGGRGEGWGGERREGSFCPTAPHTGFEHSRSARWTVR